MSKKLYLLAGSFVVIMAQPVLAEPMVEVTKGRLESPVPSRLYDQPTNPFAGSLTAPSIAQAQAKFARIPGAVDIVPAEQYSKKYATGMKEILSGTPGVFVQQRYGEEMRLSIRGSGISRGFHLRGITLLQDGVPINLADDSGDFQEIDPLTTRYTEVFKGGNGWQYGASSLGGAINVVTPTGYTAIEQNKIISEFGSYDTYREHASVARVIGKTDFYAAITGLKSHGWREQSAQEKGRFNGNVGYRLNDNAETRFYLTYNNLDQQVPGTLTLRQALDTPRMAPTANKTGDQQRNIRSVRMANKTTFQFANKVLDVGLYAAIKDLFHPISITLDQESQDYGAFARLSGNTQLAGYKNSYNVGLHAKAGHVDALVFTNIGGSRGVKTGDADQLSQQIDLTLDNQFYLQPDVALIGGIQLIHATRDFTNNLNVAANDQKDYNALNPKLGVIWDASPDTQLFANVSRSSESPTFSELVQTPIVGFVPLDPQTAWTIEMGTRGNRGDIAWDLTAYHSRIKDELLNFTVAGGVPAATFNAGDTIHQGLEMGVDWKFTPQLTLRQIYNLNDFHFRNDAQYGDNRIAGTPPHQYRAELRYQPNETWSVTPNAELVPNGGQIDHRNSFRAPGYAVFGVNASYKIKEGVEFYVDGRNLLDKRYVSNYSTVTDAAVANMAVFYPGEGRSVFSGLKVAF
jgi:iron complex outermembrane receptor protein